jgi:hypothetical protein
MTIWFETERSFHIGARAELLPDDREIAGHWASPHIVPNPANAYVIGRYAESGRANNNRQLFALEGLQMGKPSLQHAPVNINHSQRRVVGAFVASEIVYPLQSQGECMHEDHDASDCDEKHPEAAADVVPDEKLNPFMESLAVVWKHYFPDEYRAVAMAQAEGALFYSMETIPERIGCAGEKGCGAEFAYEGPRSKNYCDHLNAGVAEKLLIKPHFIGGALIIPPVRPGWSNANIKAVDLERQGQMADSLYAQIADEFSHLEPQQWEHLMREVVILSGAYPV